MPEGRFDGRAILEAMTERLVAVPPEDILRFNELFPGLERKSWKALAACYLSTGHLSDDIFDYFVRGVVALGAGSVRAVHGRSGFAGGPSGRCRDRPGPVAAACAPRRRGRLGGSRSLRASPWRRRGGVFWNAMAARAAASTASTDSTREQSQPDSSDVDVDLPRDRDLIPVRLPRLSAMFPRRP